MAERRLDVAALAEELAAATTRTAELMARAAKEPDAELAHATLQELQTEMEELRVAEEELRVQAEELAQATALIAGERRRYHDLFDFAPYGYLETDSHGTILEANRAAARLLERDQSLLPGKTLFPYVTAIGRRNELRTALRRVVAGHDRHELRVTLEPHGGNQFPAVVTLEAGEGQEGEILVRWMIRDVSESFAAAERMAALEAEVELMQRLQTLSRLLLSEHPLERSLQRIVELAHMSFPGTRASVTLRTAHVYETPVASDDVALGLDQLQYELDQGPCVEAFRTKRLQWMTATRDGNTKWPKLAAEAHRHGVEVVLAQPLLVDDEAIGALNLYAEEEEALSREHEHTIGLLAEQAASAIANARLYLTAAELAEQLDQALQSRPIIEQAKGILMAREGCDEDTAFDMLRRASQRTNVKLRDVAKQVVQANASTQGPPPH